MFTILILWSMADLLPIAFSEENRKMLHFFPWPILAYSAPLNIFLPLHSPSRMIYKWAAELEKINHICLPATLPEVWCGNLNTFIDHASHCAWTGLHKAPILKKHAWDSGRHRKEFQIAHCTPIIFLRTFHFWVPPRPLLTRPCLKTGMRTLHTCLVLSPALRD